MRKLTPARRRAVIVPAAVCSIAPSVLLLSRHAHTPANDSLVGMGVGLLLGLSGMSIYCMRRANHCNNETTTSE